MNEEKKKKGPGRPCKHGTPMSSNERQIARRIRIEYTITRGMPSLWNRQTCMTILDNKKYEMYQEEAWRRLGEIKGFKAAPEPIDED